MMRHFELHPFVRNINGIPSTIPKFNTFDKYSSTIDYNYLSSNNCNTEIIEKEGYWVSYVLSAWQFTTDSDLDPNNEGGYLGFTSGKEKASDCSVSIGKQYSFIFSEVIRDYYMDKVFIEPYEVTAAHELGHQFGLSHGNSDTGDCNPCNMVPCENLGLMRNGGPIDGNQEFVGKHINLLRCRILSPGQPK